MLLRMRVRRYRRTRRVLGRDAEVSVELRLPSRREIEDVKPLRPRGARALDRRIPDRDVLPNQVVASARANVDAIGVASDGVLLDDVAAGRADQADPEIIGRNRIAITVSFVQPDPAVVAQDSYAAAEQPGHRRAVPDRDVPLDDGLERGAEHPNTRHAVHR